MYPVTKQGRILDFNIVGDEPWNHPFKTSACSRGEGCPPLPTFADARGGRCFKDADVYIMLLSK